MPAAISHLGTGLACVCGGNFAKHNVPGFAGECTHCERCTEFRPTVRPTPVPRTAQPRHAIAEPLWLDVVVHDIDTAPHKRGTRSTPDRPRRRK